MPLPSLLSFHLPVCRAGPMRPRAAWVVARTGFSSYFIGCFCLISLAGSLQRPSPISFFFLWSHRRGILVLPAAVEAQSLNHWTAREVPSFLFIVEYSILWIYYIYLLTSSGQFGLFSCFGYSDECCYKHLCISFMVHMFPPPLWGFIQG